MPEKKIHIGILGAGGYGTTACRYLTNTGRYRIDACLDINPHMAQSAADREHAHAYTDLAAFLAHSDLEAVSINTPVRLHHEHLRRCLEAGKHVFITKPITAFPEDAERLVELAGKEKLALMVGHHARHTALSRFVRQILRAGRLGRICNVTATCCSSLGLHQKAGSWRTDPQFNPGGPLLQCGIHIIDKLAAFFGPVCRVMALMQDDITPFDVIDNTLTLLQFASGVQACFVCNYTTGYMHTMDIFGTDGNLHVREHVTDLNTREVYFQPRKSNVHEPWQPLTIPHDPDQPDDHGGILEHQFADQIQTGQFDYTNATEAIEALRVVHAAVQSHRTGEAVDMKGENTAVNGDPR